MAPYSSTLAWKIPWTEEPGRLQSMGSLRFWHDWATSLSLLISCVGEGNGNPLQCSCLENPRDFKSLLQHNNSKASILQCLAYSTVQLSHPYMTTGKTIPLSRWTFVGNVMSLLFNMLSRLVITFLPRSKRVLISWLQLPSAVILDPPPPKKNKVWDCFHCFPIYFPWSDGSRCHDLRFLNVEL